MKATAQINAEFEKRMNLVNDESFRKLCAEHAKKAGITAEEWSKNKASICLWFANEVISREN